MTNTNEFEERIRVMSEKAHIEWLSKCKTATVNGSEMTVLPYGYFQTAIKEVLREAIREAREMGLKEGVQSLTRMEIESEGIAK